MNIAVYCSSSNNIPQIYHEQTEALAQWIVAHEHTLVYGGTLMGLMGTLARTIKELNGNRIGIINQSIYEMKEVVPDTDALEVVDTLASRKDKFITLADVHLVLPGGFGTFDEVFSVLALKQIGENQTPVLFFNINNYFQGLRLMFDKIYQEKFAPEEFRKKYCFCNTITELDNCLKK